MGETTEAKLRAALFSKEGIRTAIEEKGVECGTDVPFSQYREKILSIETGNSGELIFGQVGPGGQIYGAQINIAAVGQYVKETIE